MQYAMEYGVFLAKTLTVIVLIVTALALLVRITRGPRRADGQETLTVINLNAKYEDLGRAVESAIFHGKELKRRVQASKQEHKRRERERRAGASARKRWFVLDFKGDINASAVASLRQEVTAILQVTAPADEVVLRLESAGGTVHGYGLAAAQLLRLREREVRVTVCIDRVAASGGYLLACVAHRIVAAPFAVIGSIGVIAQLPNFNRLLRNFDIDYEQITAGEYKRTLTLFGENTAQGRTKLQQEIDATHLLFKQFVQAYRPQLDIAKVATGETWYGQQALELLLIDRIETSDAYLLAASGQHDIYAVRYERPQRLLERLFRAG